MKPPASPALATDDPGSIVLAMKAELADLRDAERDKSIHGAYQAAIDRLDALAYRLAQPRPVTIGKPPRRSALVEPEPELPPPAVPQRLLPLGPVVIAHRPKRR